MLKKCLIFLAVLSFFAPVSGEVIELIYDDGSPFNGFSGGVYDNIIYAVRFTPPAGDWMIRTARYYIFRADKPAKVRLFDGSSGGPGADLITGFNITPDATGWYDVDLTDKDVWVSDEFFVGLEMLSTVQLENPALGADTEGNERSWNHVGNDWLFNEHTTYFIRAVIDDGLAVMEEPSSRNLPELSCEMVPAGSETMIEYYLPETGRVNISVWDAAGRCVGVLVDEVQNQGSNRAEWNPALTAESSGIYFITLKCSNHTVSERVVVRF